MSEKNKTHQKILDVAGKLFSTKGFKAVTLREITSTLGLKHTALFYYAKSKELLYVQVMERNFKRHEQKMEEALLHAEDDLKEQMWVVAKWLLSQPPLNLGQLMQSDFAHLSPEHGNRLAVLAFDSLRMPLTKTFQRAKDKGIIMVEDPGLAAISFVSLIETVHATQPAFDTEQRQTIVKNIIDMLLNGLYSR